MQDFINTIFDFFNIFFTAIKTYFNNNTLINEFGTKKVFDGELLSMGMNWQELMQIVLPMLISLFLIFLVFKVIWRMLFGKVRK